MSAYLCTPKHIGALAAWAVTHHEDISQGWLERLVRQTGNYGYELHELPGAVAAVLAAENIASVSYRYDSPEWGEGQRPGPTHIATDAQYIAECSEAASKLSHSLAMRQAKPLAIIKAVNCLEYQSCEHPDWKESEARMILGAILSAAISNLPGYDEAEWGWAD